jgi:hypothetical protein
VIKDVSCQRGEDTILSAQVCQTILHGIFTDTLTPDQFIITVTGNNPNPSPFKGSNIPVAVTLRDGNYQVSETINDSVEETILFLENLHPVKIEQDKIFSGDCDTITGEGTIAEGDLQICSLENVFTVTAFTPTG